MSNVGGEVENGAKNLYNNVVNTFSNPDTLNNAIANVFTAGLVGYQNGNFTMGANTRSADEAIGEVTGRNAMRKGMMDTQDAINAQAKAIQDQQNQTLIRQQGQETQAAGAAQSARTTGGFGYGRVPTSSANTTGGSSGSNPNTSWLGL